MGCQVCAVDLRLVEKVAGLMTQPPQLVCLNPNTLEDVLEDLAKVGNAVGLAEEADAAIAGLRKRIQHACDVAASGLKRRGVDPWKVGSSRLLCVSILAFRAKVWMGKPKP